MSKESEIKESLSRIIKDLLPVTSILAAKVQDVDAAKATCSVVLINNDLELKNVRLRAVIDGNLKGFLMIPKKDSLVLVGFVNGNLEEAFVSRFAEVDEIHLRSDEFGGLVKVEDLLTKINRLEDKLNSLISKHNSHIHITTATVGSTATPGILSATVATETAISPNTKKSDLENEKIKHG